MVNKRQKDEGAATKARTSGPKSRLAAKAQPASRAVAAKTAKPDSKTTVKPPTPSRDEIALRAYFIAEKRQQLGLPGDATSDWVQAEAQLLSERRTSGLN